MTAADEARINAMATARSIKALLIYLDITTMIGHPATEADIKSMNHHGKDAAVRSAGVKVASEGTWKVVQAIAARFGGPDGRGAVDVAPKLSLPPVCQIPACGCSGDAHA